MLKRFRRIFNEIRGKVAHQAPLERIADRKDM